MNMFNEEMLNAMIAEAVQAEREACAKLCEKWTPTDADGVCDVADAIRERGQA